jgi:AcrR family transcriptional regulator
MPKNSEASRQRLIEAASLRMVEANGLIEVSEVAKAASTSVGLVYHHFGSKAGLIAAIVERFYDQMEIAIRGEPVENGADWLRAEQQRLSDAISFFYSSPLTPYMLTRLSRDSEVADIERQRLQSQIEIGARNIALGQRLGAVNPQLEPELTVIVLLTGLRHAIARSLERIPRPAEAVLKKQLWVVVSRVVNNANPTQSISKKKLSAVNIKRISHRKE